jgi:hypothetical protein
MLFFAPKWEFFRVDLLRNPGGFVKSRDKCPLVNQATKMIIFLRQPGRMSQVTSIHTREVVKIKSEY